MESFCLLCPSAIVVSNTGLLTTSWYKILPTSFSFICRMLICSFGFSLLTAKLQLFPMSQKDFLECLFLLLSPALAVSNSVLASQKRLQNITLYFNTICSLPMLLRPSVICSVQYSFSNQQGTTATHISMRVIACLLQLQIQFANRSYKICRCLNEICKVVSVAAFVSTCSFELTSLTKEVTSVTLVPT